MTSIKTVAARRLTSLLVCYALCSSASAFAQEDKAEINVEATKPVETKRAKVETSNAPTKVFVYNKKIESVKKLDEIIVRLRRLIDKTRDDHPDRPKFLFDLAEAYFDKSKSYEKKAFVKQDECFAFDDQGEKGRAQACRGDMKKFIAESKKLGEENVQLYIDIVRGYPEFKELDKVYFYLGASLMETGKKDEALEIFGQLLNDYPKSKYKPNVLLAFGDYYFDRDDMASALTAYKRVRKFPKSSVHTYARYKEAWCYFNTEQKDKALDAFLQTMKLAKKNPKAPTSKTLLRQTRKDIVLTYSFIGAPEKAIPFFKKIATEKEEWLNMGERLGLLYADKGKPNDSNKMFNELIRLNKDSIKTVKYQQEIVRNTTQMNSYSQDSVKALVRLARLVKVAEDGKFKDIDKAAWKKQRTQVEAYLRSWATTYHREAQKTKNANLYAFAYFLYKEYLAAFPAGPKDYEMNFFYGELLYKLQKWEEAASAYEKVVTLQPKGKYTNESVHGLVLSYFKVVSISEEKQDLDKRSEEILSKPGEKKKGPAPIPTAKPIPEKQQKLINACNMYAELNPKGDRIVDVKYTKARIYYDYDHLDKAIASFKDIAYTHSEHRLAVIAANLHLDSWSVLQKYDNLHVDVKEYLEKQPIKDEAFLADLRKIDSNVAYKKCDDLQQKEKWKDTATCFVTFFREHPDSELVDDALYSAALAFERQRELGKAIQVRIFLLKERPDSEHAPVSLFNIGGNYHALAIYSEAAKFYEIYAQTYPKLKDAEVALSNAATFRHGLGQLDKAIENFETYLTAYGKRDPKRAAEVYFLIGEIYAQKGQKKKSFDQYNSYIRKFGKKDSPDHYMQSHIRIASYYKKLGGRSNQGKALAWYKKTLKEFGKFSKSAQEGMTIGRDAAAEAKFMLGEEVFKEMAKIKINSPNEKKLKTALKKKTDSGKEAEEIFKSVIAYNRPDWAIAAFYRIGSGYQNMADSIRKSFIPKRLTYDQKEIYRGILEDAASQVENNAVEAYKGALLIAREKSWFNKYSKDAEIALAQLRPKQFRKPSELRAEPNHLADGFARSEFTKEAKEEDRLRDLDAGGEPTTPPSEPTSQR